MAISKRAVFYTLDALIMVALITSSILLISNSDNDILLSLPDSHVSEDVMRIISEMKLSELENQTWVTEKVSSGDIADMNVTVLTQLGDFWSKDNFSLAQDLATQAVGGIAERHDFGIWINNEEIYSSDPLVNGKIISTWRVVSGLEKNKPTRGFISTARARTITKNRTLFVPISPGGSGWDEGWYTVTAFFNLSNYTIHEVEFLASIHSGTGINDMEMELNGDNACNYKRNDIDWIFLDSDGNVGNTSIPTSCLVQDINQIEIVFRNQGFNAHTHPGMYLRVKYETEEFVEKLSTAVTKKFYLNHIESRDTGNDGAGVWTAYPFDIPRGATDVKAEIQIVGDNIRDYEYPDRCRINYGGAAFNDPCADFLAWDATYKPAEDYDYILFLNADTPFDTDDAPSTSPTYYYNNTQTAPYLVNGTNILAVYFNNYLDMVWGKGDVTLYSDPIGDPSGSSYIELNYTLDTLDTIPFGAIEVNDFVEIGGNNSYTKQSSFTYPEFLDAGGDAYLHILQRDSQKVTVRSNSYFPPNTVQFTSPSDRAVPSATYLSSYFFDTSPLATNYVAVQDVDVNNDILNISKIEYNFYIPSYIGFGEVFDNQSAAQEDAENRLLARMQPYVTSDDIVASTQAVSNVPSLWGPVVVEVRSWT